MKLASKGINTGGLQLLGPFAARLLTYPITIGCSLLTATILIRGASVEDYAGYTLVASLLPLLAFLDLGYGGAAANWATEYAHSSDISTRNKLQQRLQHALRVSGVPMVLGLLGAVSTFIWTQSSGIRWLNISGAVLSLTFLVYCLTIPFSIISKLLIGTGRTTTWIFVQLVQPLIALGFVSVAVWTGGGHVVPIAPALSLLGMCLLGSYFGLKAVKIPSIGIARLFKEAKPSEGNLFASAWPMMIILIANPLALSSDRLILSAFSTTSQVASYSLAAQLFSPALALLSATGLSLWPMYAKKRYRGERSRPWPMVWSFSATAAIGSVVLLLVSPLLTKYVGGNKIDLPLVLIACLAVSFVVQAAQLPLGMYMMHGSGPKIQALLLVVMFALKFALSAALIPLVGAGGPALGTAIAIFLCQVLPGAWLILRRGI